MVCILGPVQGPRGELLLESTFCASQQLQCHWEGQCRELLGMLLIVMLAIGAVSASLYLLIDRKIGGHREHAGMAAAAYMTALGSLFAILTGFLINSEYSTLREARQIVGTEAAASSRLASATEGLPSVDASALQVRLGQYLRDASTSDWKALADGDAQDSPAFLSLRELQATVFSISSRP